MFTSNIDRYVCSPPSLFHPAYAKYPGSAYESWYCFTENVSPPLVWLEYWLEYIAIVKQEVLSGQCSVFLKVRSWKRLVLIESTPGSSAPVSSRIRESDFHYFSIFHKLIPPFPLSAFSYIAREKKGLLLFSPFFPLKRHPHRLRATKVALSEREDPLRISLVGYRRVYARSLVPDFTDKTGASVVRTILR